MGTPYTSGKNDERGSAKPGGKFTVGTGGHTSRGVHEPDHGAKKSGAARSKKTTRVGNLGTRTQGAGGRVAGI